MKYNFPKVDLHLHLDGSNRIDTIWQLAQEQGVKLPGETKQDYDDYLRRCQTSGSVNEFLKQFDAPLLVQQDKQSLSRVTFELIEDLHNQGLAYAEIRFAPQLHTQKGMSQSDAVEAVLDGKTKAEEKYPDIKIGIITCMMSFGPTSLNYDANMETVEVCKKYLGKGVVCLDLAGAENIVPLSDFKSFFDKANEYGLPIICHAGDSQDWTACETAIKDFKALRLGHGHHIYENPELCRYAADHDIALEICPTSNIQCLTRKTYPLHPANNLLNMGIPVTINTDNMTMSRVTLDDEYDHCLNEMGFEYEDLILMNINSVKHSFMSEEDKKVLIEKLEKCLEEC